MPRKKKVPPKWKRQFIKEMKKSPYGRFYELRFDPVFTVDLSYTSYLFSLFHPQEENTNNE